MGKEEIKIGKQIREDRQLLNLTVDELSQLTGLSRTFITNIELERTEVVEKLNKILNVLNDMKTNQKEQPKAGAKELVLHEDPLPSPYEKIISMGIDKDIQKFFMLNLICNAHTTYSDAVAKYVANYTGIYDLYRHRVFKYAIAIKFTYALASRVQNYILAEAEKQGIKPDAVQINRIEVIGWQEELNNELDQYITNILNEENQNEPAELMDEEYVKLLEKGFSPARKI